MSKFIPVCLICNKEYYSKVGLKMHLDNEHSKDELVKSIKSWGVYVN